jgi:hypothetical protein
MADQQRIRKLIPGGEWHLSICLVSFLVGGPSGFAVADFLPEGSDGPIFVGAAVFGWLFAVLAAIGAIGGRILIGLAEHAAERDDSAVSGGRD